MRFSFATLALLVAPALAGPVALKTVETFAGEKKANSYIVTLNKGVAKDGYLANLLQHFEANDKVTHGHWDSKVFNGFAAKLGPVALNFLRAHPEVAKIEEDGIFTIQATTTQTNAPWGLQRISQIAKLSSTSTTSLTYKYQYDSRGGSGVDVYVVDTGVYTAHSQFGGRARWGATFGGYANQDGNGHGTHVAGTVGGSQFGVAKSASIIAVKVLSDAGSGSTSDIVSGLNWVGTQAKSSGRPSIATLSLGGGASSSLDSAVTSLVAQGVHVTVAAGNDGVNAANTSPARAPNVITVGATSISDAKASFSNYGPVVDIFAPGQAITSAWIGSTTATNSISGTSMATPHIAGLLAYLISVNGNSTPATLTNTLKSLATKNALTAVPSGTVNYLAYNGISA